MAEIPSNIGQSEPDGEGRIEMNHGDGTNLVRPKTSEDKNPKTQDALDKLGKGKPYGCTNSGCWI